MHDGRKTAQESSTWAPFEPINAWPDTPEWSSSTEVWPCSFNTQAELPKLELGLALELELEDQLLQSPQRGRGVMVLLLLLTVVWFCFAIKVGTLMPREGVDIMAVWGLAFFTGLVLAADCLLWFMMADIMRRTR